MRDLERYLMLRGKTYYYKRKVPTEFAQIDKRAPVVEMSLRTRNFEEAIARRNYQEKHDDALWSALRTRDPHEIARAAGQAFLDAKHMAGLPSPGHDRDFAVAPVLTRYLDLLETDYPEAEAYFKSMPQPYQVYVGNYLVQKQLIERHLSANSEVTQAVVAVSANITTTNQTDGPTLREAFKRWLETGGQEELHTKSPSQRRTFIQTRQRAVERFCEVVGNLHVFRIGRAQAVEFQSFWRKRIYPSKDQKGYSANSGNKEIGFLCKLWRETAHEAGRFDLQNPFNELSFQDKKKVPEAPKSYSSEWLEKRWLKGSGLAGLNPEIRRVLLVMIETGARPNEIFNLSPERIILDAEVPHIRIWSEDGDRPIEVKTAASHRMVPLVGVALASMRLQPNGFPRYRDKSGSFSAAANKYIRANGLTDGNKTVYSLRDTYIDRLRAAGVGDDLRREISGHATNDAHAGYGDGVSLAKKHEIMEKIALRFDPTIV